jgi:hypothetical protein
MMTKQLPERGIFTMIVLSFVTLGFYYPIWFLRCRDGLNALDSPRKLAWWPAVLMMAVQALQYIINRDIVPALATA